MLEERLNQELAQVRARKKLPTPTARQAVRERSGITQAALARVLEVDPATVSRWESGERVPSGERLTAYLAALDRLAREAL
ncbi:MAG: helix-turn-helix domain-containing protein [Acidobacteriia bacterium]|nr:helix-turn-helix domain-containing protein [Terriglobia bacterium]